MKLCIPTLNQYERLNRLIRSAEDGALKPEAYVIIDNGGGYELPQEFTGLRVEIVRPGRNIGVAASWNYFLDIGLEDDRPIAISNDDIVFGKNTFLELEKASTEAPFVGACGGWALFSQSPSCTKAVGYYDEHFYPAYYEDCDYLLRIRRAGVPRADIGWADAAHYGEASTTDETRADIEESRSRNYSYFVTKWGTDSPRWGDPLVENFQTPFDGQLEPGPVLSADVDRTAISPLRYDVLNFIAERIGAERYLEIGVSDGASMRHVRVKEKWGVDPSPQLSGVAASTVFVPHTSDYFFEHIAPHVGEFDLVFIDGDHRAKQVYREAKNALRFLSKKGFVCFHDSNPHTEAMQEVPHRTGWQWTGDVWKAIARLRSEGENLRVIPADFGIGVLVPAARSVLQPRIALPYPWDRLMYKDLVADRAHLLGLIRPGGWKEWISKHCT